MHMAQAAHPVKTDTHTEHDRLGALLISRGHCDSKTLDRARNVAAESGQRLVAANRYPAEPLLLERLNPKFLHQARALPLAIHDDRLHLALADPLDRFTPAAVAAATGLAIAPDGSATERRARAQRFARATIWVGLTKRSAISSQTRVVIM